MTKEYDRLLEILRLSQPSDVVAALLEVWSFEKLEYLMEELDIELYDGDEAETESTH